MPNRYKPTSTSQRYCGSKNAPAMVVYMSIFAEQLIKGVSSIVILRSRSLESVLVAIIAGTEQPNPISIGTKLLPERPNFLSGLSITNATRAI